MWPRISECYDRSVGEWNDLLFDVYVIKSNGRENLKEPIVQRAACFAATNELRSIQSEGGKVGQLNRQDVGRLAEADPTIVKHRFKRWNFNRNAVSFVALVDEHPSLDVRIGRRLFHEPSEAN